MPVARELVSTHTLMSCPCKRSLCITLAIVSRTICRSGASSVVSSHPQVTTLALRFIIPVAAWSHPHTGRYLISFPHRQKTVRRVTTSGTSGITLPHSHCKVQRSSQTSNPSTRTPSSSSSGSFLSSPNQRKCCFTRSTGATLLLMNISSMYADYFKGNKILPIPEILQKLEPRIISLVVTDLRSRRLVGLKKEGFEDLIRKAGVPCQYFCQKSFATWDILLPSSEQADKVASGNIITKFFRRQPESLGTYRIRVTVCKVPAFITGEVLATFLSAYECVKEINLLRSAAGTAYEDYVFPICLTREGFQAIPETIISRERQMMVVVEGRRPHYWRCKQLGHISKFYSQKDLPNAAAATVATEIAATTVSTATINSKIKTSEKDHAQLKKRKTVGLR